RRIKRRSNAANRDAPRGNDVIKEKVNRQRAHDCREYEQGSLRGSMRRAIRFSLQNRISCGHSPAKLPAPGQGFETERPWQQRATGAGVARPGRAECRQPYAVDVRLQRGATK